MLARFAFLLSVVSLVLIAALAISCGGSSKSLPGCTATMGPAYDVAGNWTLSVAGTAGNYSGNPGVISTAGLALFFEPVSAAGGVGDTAVLPEITGGSNCVSGNLISYATPFNGGGSVTDQATATINSNASISGAFKGSTASGTFTLAAASPLTGSASALSGTGWSGEIEGAAVADILQFTFTATGTNSNMSFTGTDSASCTVSGTFAQERGTSALDVFDVSITYTGSSCPAAGTVSGLGFESDSDYFNMNGSASGTYLYAVPSASASVLEIFKPQAR